MSIFPYQMKNAITTIKIYRTEIELIRMYCLILETNKYERQQIYQT